MRCSWLWVRVVITCGAAGITLRAGKARACRSAQFGFEFQTAAGAIQPTLRRPYFLQGAGSAFILPLAGPFPRTSPRGWSAKRRNLISPTPCGARARIAPGRAPLSAPSRHLQAGPARCGSRHQPRAAFLEPGIRAGQCSELLAAVPVVATERGPGAARVRGYEPRPQAPHPIPSARRLMMTPPEDRMKEYNQIKGIKSSTTVYSGLPPWMTRRHAGRSFSRCSCRQLR